MPMALLMWLDREYKLKLCKVYVLWIKSWFQSFLFKSLKTVHKKGWKSSELRVWGLNREPVRLRTFHTWLVVVGRLVF